MYIQCEIIYKIFKRLKVEQTLFGETVEFNMRTFRFATGGSVATSQTQKVECDLHLEPTEDILREQAADCTCYDEKQCQRKRFFNSNKI